MTGFSNTQRVDVVTYNTDAGQRMTVIPAGNMPKFRDWVRRERRVLLKDVAGKYGFGISVMLLITGMMLYAKSVQVIAAFSIITSMAMQRNGCFMQSHPDHWKITPGSTRVVKRNTTYSAAVTEYNLDTWILNEYCDAWQEESSNTLSVIDCDSPVGYALTGNAHPVIDVYSNE